MYLAAIRFFPSINQLPNSLHDWNGALNFSITALLKAVEKVQKPCRSLRLPIDILLLTQMCALLNGSYFDAYSDALFKAVLLCAFFGFLSPWEFTTQQSDSSRNLTLSDVSFVRNAVTLFKTLKV